MNAIMIVKLAELVQEQDAGESLPKGMEGISVEDVIVDLKTGDVLLNLRVTDPSLADVIRKARETSGEADPKPS